jgi:glutamate-1-semialdehyde aminotransferase
MHQLSDLAGRAGIIPGRSLTRSKAVFGQWARDASGATIIGADGREYLDMLCALGAVTRGYRDDGGWSPGVMSLPHEVEVEAAEAVLAHVAPWASSVRFTVTGSEATHAAYRIARAATGRKHVIAGSWAYHGWHAWCSPVPTRFEHGDSLSARYSGPWHWLKALTRLGVSANTIAAVFIEPHRWEPVDVEWLRSVRAFCDRIGSLLVFDSMIYGGRMALGGASEYFGVQPDIECFGKAFGNGQPVAFIVGNEAVAKHGEIPSGTYSGYPQGLQAVVDTIHAYTTQPIIETLWARGRQLQDGLRRVIPAHLGVCEGLPVHQRVRFFNEAHGLAFSKAMQARGILAHPGCLNVMAAHTEAQIARVIAAAAESVGEM